MAAQEKPRASARATAGGIRGQTRPSRASRRGSTAGTGRILAPAATLTPSQTAVTNEQMDARHRDVLIATIREYIDSAEPVGSRALVKRHFPHLSPATIRNAMADLEELGYLAQPHTSAGRIPTDKAYRFYVDSFPPPSSAIPTPGGGSLPTRRSGIDPFMERT